MTDSRTRSMQYAVLAPFSAVTWGQTMGRAGGLGGGEAPGAASSSTHRFFPRELPGSPSFASVSMFVGICCIAWGALSCVGAQQASSGWPFGNGQDTETRVRIHGRTCRAASITLSRPLEPRPSTPRDGGRHLPDVSASLARPGPELNPGGEPLSHLGSPAFAVRVAARPRGALPRNGQQTAVHLPERRGRYAPMFCVGWDV